VGLRPRLVGQGNEGKAERVAGPRAAGHCPRTRPCRSREMSETCCSWVKLSAWLSHPTPQAQHKGPIDDAAAHEPSSLRPVLSCS
jgi:hypothetical protein